MEQKKRYENKERKTLKRYCYHEEYKELLHVLLQIKIKAQKDEENGEDIVLGGH